MIKGQEYVKILVNSAITLEFLQQTAWVFFFLPLSSQAIFLTLEVAKILWLFGYLIHPDG